MGTLSNLKKTLIEESKSGNLAAFEKLSTIHYSKVYNYALRICGGDASLAYDLTQDAFVKAFLHIEKFDEKANFTAWLWRVIYNAFIDYTRKEARTATKEQIEEPISELTPEELFEQKTQKKALYSLIAKVSSPFKEVLVLIEIIGFSYEEAAQITDAPVGTVRSRLSRAREELKELIWKNQELFTSPNR